MKIYLWLILPFLVSFALPALDFSSVLEFPGVPSGDVPSLGLSGWEAAEVVHRLPFEPSAPVAMSWFTILLVNLANPLFVVAVFLGVRGRHHHAMIAAVIAATSAGYWLVSDSLELSLLGTGYWLWLLTILASAGMAFRLRGADVVPVPVRARRGYVVVRQPVSSR